MKLPLFHIQRQFKDLFKEMDTEYQKNEVNVWNFQGDSILDRIIKEGEVIVEEGDISNYIEDDGFFRVEGKLVLVYIRDQFIRNCGIGISDITCWQSGNNWRDCQ